MRMHTPPAGLTIIEPLIFLAVLGVVLAAAGLSLSAGLVRHEVDRAAAEAADALHEAQASAIAGKLNGLGTPDAKYGVRFEAGRFCRFEGADTGSPPASCDGNQVLAVRDLAGLVSVTAGTGAVTFADRRGKPGASASVTFTAGAETRIVCLNAEGRIDVLTSGTCP